MDVDINEGTPSRKRRKLSSGGHQLENQLTPAGTDGLGPMRRGKTWMDDGNLIIQAYRTQFRVHKSMLYRCSSVFEDMFSLPQPSSDTSEATLDGCQVVHLYDSAEDIEYLLSALYDYKYSVDPTNPEAMDMRVVSALLRLGNKYDIPHLRRSMLLRIHAEYPTSIQKAYFDSFIYFVSTDWIHIDVVNLLYHEGIFSPLPLALYFIICLYTTEQILEGIQRDDGTKATLPVSMITACLLGKERLVKVMSDISYKWLRERSSGAKFCGRITCRPIFFTLEKTILHIIPNLAYALDYSWKEVLELNKFNESSLCPICDEAARLQHEEGRKAVFEALPSVFGYKSWDEVKQMDRYQL